MATDAYKPIRERATITYEHNGVWNGYTIEVANVQEVSFLPDEYYLRFIFWEGDEDTACIEEIIELEVEYVRKHLRPRAGFCFCKDNPRYHFAAGPVRAALAKVDSRLVEEVANIAAAHARIETNL